MTRGNVGASWDAEQVETPATARTAPGHDATKEAQMKGTYSYQCDRCPTSAIDSSRAGIELFTQHHMKTAHPASVFDPSALWLLPSGPAKENPNCRLSTSESETRVRPRGLRRAA